jgi:hypothetical protein
VEELELGSEGILTPVAQKHRSAAATEKGILDI